MMRWYNKIIKKGGTEGRRVGLFFSIKNSVGIVVLSFHYSILLVTFLVPGIQFLTCTLFAGVLMLAL